MSEHGEDDEDFRAHKPLSKASGLTIGLALGIMTVVGSAIWWASSVSSRLDELVIFIHAQEKSINSVESDMKLVRDRVLILEQKVSRIDKKGL